MYGQTDLIEFLDSIAGHLALYYAAMALANAVAAIAVWRSGQDRICGWGPFAFGWRHVWLLATGLFAIATATAATGDPTYLRWLALPEVVKTALNALTRPTVFILGSMGLLAFVFYARRFFVRPVVAWSLFNLAMLWMGLSMTDPDFVKIVAKPDNVAIVGLFYLLAFFTWLGAARAVANDDRHARGEPPLEKLEDDKVLVWPDLVYIELICMVAVTTLLIVWAIALKAPLEEPASIVKTPNPSKAPWYFLGLQEMLLYFDPWMSGVVLPSLIIFGLAAIPYLDVNPAGSGFYTIEQRKFAYVVHQFGFLVLWIALILLGTFVRGPNWNSFGLYETWDVHKVASLKNVDLSEYFWIGLLDVPRPQPPEDATGFAKLGVVLYRELPGLLAVLFYMTAIPLGLVWFTKFYRNLFREMGFTRFSVMMFLLLVMGMLPMKMLCRWSFNLMYFIAMPEYSLNL